MLLKSYLPDAIIPDISLGEYIISALEQQDGDKVAVIEMHSGNVITYKELKDEALRLAGLLWKAGLRKGDIVGLALPFDMKYLPLFIAIPYCGAILFGCKLLFKYSVCKQLASIKPTLVIAENDRLDEISKDIKANVPNVKLCLSFDQLQHVKPGSLRKVENDMPCYEYIKVRNDPAIIYQSSGTTGEPKGIVITHHAAVASSVGLKSTFRLVPDDVLSGSMNIIHVYSLALSFYCITHGVTLAYAASLTAKQHLEFIEKYKINISFITNLNTLKEMAENDELSRNIDLSSLVSIAVGGTTIPSDIISLARKKLGVVVSQAYGLSEGGTVSYGPTNRTPPNSVGRLFGNVRVKVLDVVSREELGCGERGEICIKSPQMLKEYLVSDGVAPLGVKDGWLCSGDLGYFDKNGFLYVSGRLKDAIKIQPGNVTMMPAELEDILLRHEKISDVAVAAVPHPEHGEAPRAFIVRKDETLSEEDIVQFFNSEIENITGLHGGIEFVPIIPRTELGKPLRRELVEGVSK